MSNPLTLPEWFGPDAEAPVVSDTPVRRARVGPVRRALGRLADGITREFASPLAAGSWMGSLEPRAKVLGLFALTIGATLVHDLQPLVALLALAVALALSCGIGPCRLARVWLGVPLFSLAIILPATLNLVTDGPPVLTLLHLEPGATLGRWPLPEALAVTQPGLVVAGRFLLRTTACVTSMFLLVATTSSAQLIASLRRLGMPRAFGMVLAMSHRYLVVLMRAAAEIHMAKVSRTIVPGSLAGEQRWVGAGAGILFRRAYGMAGDVHAAMVSRGYDGDLQVWPAERLRGRDIAFAAGAALLLTVLVLADRWV